MSRRFIIAPLVHVLSTALLSHLILLICNASEAHRKPYIAYMGDRLDNELQATSSHHSILQELTNLDSVDARSLLLHSYKRSLNGFAAYLTDQEAQKLSGMEGIVSVFASKTYELQTTRSWDFMGFPLDAKREKGVESDVIIGLLDSGIWPESESFRDEGFGPPPTKWKGRCDSSANFRCNNKLIGARVYNGSLHGWLGQDGSSSSPRDYLGHGTSTASTAAGQEVGGASFGGVAMGTARGGAPSARIAMYKIFSTRRCPETTLLAAIDDAIADGVDILSLSLGLRRDIHEEAPGAGHDFLLNALDIGTFHAMKKGVFTCVSAGNNGGMGHASLLNMMPWATIVAASTMDRAIFNKVVLGDGRNMTGRTINAFPSQTVPSPLIWSRHALNKTAKALPGDDPCDSDMLDRDKVNGKIVVCDTKYGLVGGGILSTGAAGGITLLLDDDPLDSIYPLPASQLTSQHDFDDLMKYMRRTRHAEAKILTSESSYDSSAPKVAYFSSRGPSTFTPDILKPDITAPGVNVLAAWSPLSSPSHAEGDTRSVKYNILSGTSLACPHVAGADAYVKSFHPSWSPAAIRSALMTTAWPLNSTSSGDLELAYGSGHLNPVGALHPGLVYDANEADYVDMLCHLGYDTNQLRRVTGDNGSRCSTSTQNQTAVWALNYPSISLSISRLQPQYSPDLAIHAAFPRTVTNVGEPNATYTATIHNPHSPTIEITVEPTVLVFEKLYEKKQFTVEVSIWETSTPTRNMVNSASIIWSSGNNTVRSPIVIHSIHV